MPSIAVSKHSRDLPLSSMWFDPSRRGCKNGKRTFVLNKYVDFSDNLVYDLVYQKNGGILS
nr:MAG TPA: hypothetical protein [Caudoviricetes sp.]